jgi:hypothetical protein
VLLNHGKREEALQALTMLSTFWIELFDHVGAVLAEAHEAEERQNAARSSRANSAVLTKLLCGVEPRSVQARELRRMCGLTAGAPMAVAVARPFEARDGRRGDVEAALRSVARLLQERLPSSAFGKLVDIQGGEVLAIVSSDGDTARLLVDALRRNRFGRGAAKGLGARLGVSLNVGEIARLPQCLAEARAALEFTYAAAPVVHFADIDLMEFLVRRADDLALRLVPPVIGLVQGELEETMRIFAECSLNVKQTAMRLGVHTNTVYFRSKPIQKLTGLNARTFAGASNLMAAMGLGKSRMNS